MTGRVGNDRLYELLPAVHRIRDAAVGEPLRDLLRVIAEQVTVIERDIGRLYDDWFIDTCEDWVVPYIAELVGFRPAFESQAAPAGPAAGRENPLLDRILYPRAEVADTVGLRRRKGTVTALEQVVRAATGWAAVAVEGAEFLATTQTLRRPDRQGHGTTRLAHFARWRMRDPFARTARTLRITSPSTAAPDPAAPDPAIPDPAVFDPQPRSAMLFVWRYDVWGPIESEAVLSKVVNGRPVYTIDPLGYDVPLFNRPSACDRGAAPQGRLDVPDRIRRSELAAGGGACRRFYGPARSLTVFEHAPGGESTLVPAERIEPADLSDENISATLNALREAAPDGEQREEQSGGRPRGPVLLDPQTGRLAWKSANATTDKKLSVVWHAGGVGAIGGGAYPREIELLRGYRVTVPRRDLPLDQILRSLAAVEDRPGEPLKFRFTGRTAAVWQDGFIYPLARPAKSLHLSLEPDAQLVLRAADGFQPTLAGSAEPPDGAGAASNPPTVTVELAEGASLVVDGLRLSLQELEIRSAKRFDPRDPFISRPRVELRDCTLLPPRKDGPDWTAGSPLVLHNYWGDVTISRSVVSRIDAKADATTDTENCPEVKLKPLPAWLTVSDSVIGSVGPVAVGPGAVEGYANVLLESRRSTVLGETRVEQVLLGENSIFAGCVRVGRRDGCLRYCYVHNGRHTASLPRQTECPSCNGPGGRPDRGRGEPLFISLCPGDPHFARLHPRCPPSISRGADDGGAMGAFHDLYLPLRDAVLRARMEDFVPSTYEPRLHYADLNRDGLDRAGLPPARRAADVRCKPRGNAQ